MDYLIITTALAAGWLAGLLTFRRSLRWCPTCGADLKCPRCVHYLTR